MTLLLFLLAPLVILFIARLYASANSNTSQTTAEALVRWLTILAWFTNSLAAGADKALVQYREYRWRWEEQPACERFRPWVVAADEPVAAPKDTAEKREARADPPLRMSFATWLRGLLA